MQHLPRVDLKFGEDLSDETKDHMMSGHRQGLRRRVSHPRARKRGRTARPLDEVVLPPVCGRLIPVLHLFGIRDLILALGSGPSQRGGVFPRGRVLWQLSAEVLPGSEWNVIPRLPRGEVRWRLL